MSKAYKNNIIPAGTYLAVDSCYLLSYIKYPFGRGADQVALKKIYKRFGEVSWSNTQKHGEYYGFSAPLTVLCLHNGQEIDVVYLQNNYRDCGHVKLIGGGRSIKIDAGCDAGHHILIDLEKYPFAKTWADPDKGKIDGTFDVVEIKKTIKNPIVLGRENYPILW